MSSPAPTQQKKKRSGGASSGTLVRTYLVAYNVLSAAGWTLVLYRTLEHLFAFLPAASAAKATATGGGGGASSFLAALKPSSLLLVWVPSILPAHLVPFYQRACTTYDVVGETTAIVQSAAVLEIVHVLFGLVRSPLPTTAMQVASRLFSVWCLANEFPSAQRSPFYASMVLSWALTEVVRYSFYAASLIGSEFAPLLWLRYSTFFALYPTGAGSEAFVNLATLPISIATGGTWFSMLPLEQWDKYSHLRGALFILWWPGLYVMYTHMIKQRRKVYGGQKLGAKPKTH